MPRELVHWEIAEEIAKRVPEASFLTARYASLYHLGAMAPDALYYYAGGGSEYEKLAEVLHGTEGNDPFDPLRKGLQSLDGGITGQGQLSFIAGILTHDIVDAVFHPLIYYFTGNYYDPDPRQRTKARTDHRAYEVELDYFWVKGFKKPHVTSYREVLTKDAGKIFEWFSAVLPAPWEKAFRQMSFYQQLFRSKVVKGVATVLGKIWHEKYGEIVALFDRECDLSRFEKDQVYKNPVSGTPIVTSFGTLREEAINQCVVIFKRWAQGNRTLPEPGRNLNSGLVGTRRAEMKWYISSR